MLKEMMGIPLLPINAAAHGDQVDLLIVVVHWFMLALAVFWGVYFIYALIRFRAGAKTKADYHGIQSHFSQYLELGVILVEVVLLVGLSIPLYTKWVAEFPEEKDSTMVRVIAEQFAWNFHYAGDDGKFGRTSPSLIDLQSNPLGLDPADPASKDDVVSGVLNLPVNRPVITHISSKDVIHNFGIPALRVKQDAIPGMSIPNAFTPTREGKYLIACSQLCGNGHALMRGFVVVQSPSEFKSWYAAQLAPAAGAKVAKK